MTEFYYLDSPSHPTMASFFQKHFETASDGIQPIKPLGELGAKLLLVPSLRDALDEISAVRNRPDGDLNP